MNTPRKAPVRIAPQPTPSVRHPLLDHLRETHRLVNDRELGEALGFSSSAVSKIRHGRRPVTDDLILAVHECFGMPFAEIRSLAGARA